MGLLIEIREPATDRSIQPKDGRPAFQIREQPAWAHLPDSPYPVAIRFRLKDGVNYAAGKYELAPSSYWVNRYGELQITPELRAVRAAAAKVA